jgi:type II secretory pathway pseudopilin PulG
VRLLRQHGFSTLELLATLGIIGIVGAMALPSTTRAMADLRLRGDARNLHNAVSLAKMRAAARYTRERIYVDLTTNNYKLQNWDKTASAWQDERESNALGYGVSFGYGTLASPPPNTQAAIGQSPECTNDAGTAISNTSCIVFNSRGIPIDPSTGSPTGNSAFYVSDGGMTYAITLSATPLIRLWSTKAGGAEWIHR